MDLTKQILTLKNIAKDFNQELVYVEVKLYNEYIHCHIPYQDTGSNKGDEYTIDIEQYLKGYECVLAEIGYLTYPLNHSQFSKSLSKLMYTHAYKDIGLKDSQYRIPVLLYVQNDKFGLAYSNGTILNIFGKTVKKVIDKLNDMCNNNPNFKFHINEKFYNSL